MLDSSLSNPIYREKYLRRNVQDPIRSMSILGKKQKPQIHNEKPIAIQNTFCNAQPKQNINIATQESLNFCILYQIGKVILC